LTLGSGSHLVLFDILSHAAYIATIAN
jgi:hypothetical protein